MKYGCLWWGWGISHELTYHMDIIIIEDELPARQKLESMLQEIDPEIRIRKNLTSVKETIQWLYTNPKPDLAFVDIQLSDDHSFEIFRQYPVDFPVIFTTAFDKYLMESLEYNTVDYLLKPITEEKLRRTLDKVKKLERHFVVKNIMNLVQHERKPQALTRLITRKGTEFVALSIGQIAYFYTEHKIIFVKDFEGRLLTVDSTLSELEALLDGTQFFRLNRKYLSSIRAIEKFKSDSGKIKVSLNPPTREDVHVSKETAPVFRQWVGGSQ